MAGMGCSWSAAINDCYGFAEDAGQGEESQGKSAVIGGDGASNRKRLVGKKAAAG
uniref:Uncharacterized protein n=1 Tax=Aegilops tauschii TaxID=37682 RepID=M8BRD2_AEGTA